MTREHRGYRISEVARRSGFSASTLRYYETLGLISPARTDAGYRLFDDRTVEWLGFVSRGKGLGLSLAEIRDLAPLWDGDHCASAARRLRALVGTKLATVQGRIVELVAMAGTLERAEAELAGEHTDDPCGDGCVCQTAGSTAGSSAGLPTPQSAPPIACSLEPERVPDRIGDWKALVAAAVSRTEVDGGVRLTFPPGPGLATRVAALAAAEQSCCAFFDFTVRITVGATVLEARAPEGGQEIVAALFAAA